MHAGRSAGRKDQSAGFLIVADATRPETFDVALDLERRAFEVAPESARVLVLNKQDPAPGSISAPTLANVEQRGLVIIRTSALTGEGVDEAFGTLADRLLGKEVTRVEEA